MKITFYPTKAAVLGKLAHSLKQTQEGLDEAEGLLRELEEKTSGSNFYNPENERKKLDYKREIQMHKATEESILDTIGLIESQTDGSVQAETEV